MNGMLAVKDRKMELGSSSLPTSGASPSNDSLNGLKFGKKIYLGDVGVGISAKTGTPAASSSVANVGVVAAAPRKGRGLVQGKPPRCLVEGCKVDLTGAKAYYWKHKVCGMHSKSTTVIVNGLEQRFCQQCNRFHQLPEFDQGKRSCHRRLAGHNERRRKPSLESLTSRYERLPSSFHGFLMDFSHRRSVGRHIWPTVRAGGERIPSNRSPAVGKSLPNLGQGNLEARSASDSSHISQPCLQSSLGRTSFPSSEIPVKETFMGISNSGGALSLLPTRPWGPRNRNSVVAADNFTKEEDRMAQFSQGVAANNFMSNAWGYKNQETRSSSHGVQRELGLGQVAESVSSPISGELESAQQGRKRYIDFGHSRAYGSSGNQMHWSL